MTPQRSRAPVAVRGSWSGWLNSHGFAMGAVMVPSSHPREGVARMLAAVAVKRAFDARSQPATPVRAAREWTPRRRELSRVAPASAAACSHRRGRQAAVAPAAGRFLREPALLEPEAPVRLVGQRPVVGHHQDGGVVVPAERAEQLDDVLARLLVQVAGGLVGQDQLGFVRQRPGDRHALLLAAGEPVDPARVLLRVELDLLEQLAAPARPARLAHAGELHRQHHVVHARTGSGSG